MFCGFSNLTSKPSTEETGRYPRRPERSLTPASASKAVTPASILPLGMARWINSVSFVRSDMLVSLF